VQTTESAQLRLTKKDDSMKHILLAVALLFSAHLARSAPIGAVVQTWSYDRQTNFVTLTIINTSQKDITAFNMAIKETYADGSVSQHEVLEELVGKILAAQQLKGTAQEAGFRRHYGDGVFHAGGTLDEKVAVLTGLTDFQAVIDVVTYTDGTADSKNNDAFGRIVEERKATIASKKVAIDFIKSALADTNDPDPSATAAKNIKDRAMVWRASHTKMDLDPVVLESIANEIKRASSGISPDKRDALNRLVNKEESNISMLSVHAAVVENKGGPQ